MNSLLRGGRETPGSPVRVEHLLASTRNDCEPVVREMHPEVGEAIDWLSRYGAARMTGTGATVFAPFGSREQAVEVANSVPSAVARTDGPRTQSIATARLRESVCGVEGEFGSSSQPWGVAKR